MEVTYTRDAPLLTALAKGVFTGFRGMPVTRYARGDVGRPPVSGLEALRIQMDDDTSVALGFIEGTLVEIVPLGPADYPRRISIRDIETDVALEPDFFEPMGGRFDEHTTRKIDMLRGEMMGCLP